MLAALTDTRASPYRRGCGTDGSGLRWTESRTPSENRGFLGGPCRGGPLDRPARMRLGRQNQLNNNASLHTGRLSSGPS